MRSEQATPAARAPQGFFDRNGDGAEVAYAPSAAAVAAAAAERAAAAAAAAAAAPSQSFKEWRAAAQLRAGQEAPPGRRKRR